MRTVKILLALFAAVVVFNSCNKEYEAPTITWEPDPDKMSQLVEMSDESSLNQALTVTFTAEAGIKDIKIWRNTWLNGVASPTAAIVDGPAISAYEGLTSYEYAFATNHTLEDFQGGVMKIVYEFEVTDQSEEAQTTTKEYTFFAWETQAVTFVIKDAADTEITDAKVTLGTESKTAAPYVFYVEDGTYHYTVEKEGFAPVTGEVVVAGAEKEVSVTLQANLADWSEKILIAHPSQLGYATYADTRVETASNDVIGVEYKQNNTAGTAAIIVPTANCTGFVVIANDAAHTTSDDLEAAYTAGTAVTQLELGFTYHAPKAYAEKNFIAKVGNEYVWVKYVDGHVAPSATSDGYSGNTLAFQYKK